MNNNFYVYVYLDSRKPGEYKYGEYVFDYEPIYVGKGINNRVKRHINLCKKSNTHFHNKLRLIIKDGFDPLYKILISNLSESESHKEEIRIIKIIGREEYGGCLTNLSNGGDGQSGFKHRPESKLKTSNSLKNNKEFQNYMKTSEFSKKVSDGLIGHVGYGIGIPRTEEVRRKISESLKKIPGRKHTKESKEKMSKNNSGIGNSNSCKYTIECPDGLVLEFFGRYQMKCYFYEISKNKGRISFETLLSKGENKGYKLIKKEKVYKKS